MSVEQDNPYEAREYLQPSPLDFIVIGSGQVVDKYWLRSEADGSVKIPAIISLEPEQSFRTRNPNFEGRYHQSTSVGDTLLRVEALVSGGISPNIAIATPANVRLALVSGVLSSSNEARVFVEKPYAGNQADLDAFGDLISRYPMRMHLSGKYANGRANILYTHLPDGVAPRNIVGRLIEGTQYFNIVKERVANEGTHPYLVDGPELDLGFHLADILAVASGKFGGIEALRIARVYDLSLERAEFEAQYGFGAVLEIKNSGHEPILVDLQAGKADAPNERFMEFDYGDSTVGQEYTVGDSIDPVYVLRDGIKRVVAKHPPGYNYYSRELHPSVFSQQSPNQQALSLFITRVCLDIKRHRSELAA